MTEPSSSTLLRTAGAEFDQSCETGFFIIKLLLLGYPVCVLGKIILNNKLGPTQQQKWFSGRN